MLVTHDYRQALLPQPFWTTLSPTTVKQRIEQLLIAEDSAVRVQALSPVEYVVLLKEAPEMRPALLSLGHAEQIRAVLDLDCWHKDALQGSRVLTWLEDLQQSGEAAFQQALQTLDRELLCVAFRHFVRIHAALPEEEEQDPQPYDEVVSNELYRLEFVDPQSPWNERIWRLFDFLRRTAPDMYHSLMQGIMWGLENELEELAYRWRSGRMQDEGFPEYYEALETYQTMALEAPQLSPAVAVPGPPASVENSGLIPSYAWRLAPADTPLAQALAADFPGLTLERLCWEMVVLCNRELVIDQVDFADAAAVCASLGRVFAHINVGLEYLSKHEGQQLETLLATRSLQAICQVGVSLSIQLRQRAQRLQDRLHTAATIRRDVPGMGRHVLDGLLSPLHPQFFAGLADPGETAYRDFFSLQDIVFVDTLLQQLENDPAYHSGSFPG